MMMKIDRLGMKGKKEGLFKKKRKGGEKKKREGTTNNWNLLREAWQLLACSVD